MAFHAYRVTAATVLAATAVACSSPPPAPAPTAQPPIPTLPEHPTATPTPSSLELEERATDLLSAAVAAAGEGQEEQSMSLLAAAAAVAPERTETEHLATYLLGRRLADRGDLEGAQRQLEISLSANGPLTPYARLTLASVLAAVGNREVAAAILSELAAGDSSPPDVTDRAVEALLALEEGGDREPLASVPTGPSALLALATAYAEAADTAALEDAALRLITEYPTAAEAIAAIGLADEAGISLPPERAGLAYYRNRMLPETIEVLRPAVDEEGIPGALLAQRIYYLAAAIDDSGDPAGSVALYDEVGPLVPGSDLAARAAYWAARAVEATGDPDSASARYVSFVAGFPSSPFAAEAAFRAGFVWLQDGSPEMALSAWELSEAGADERVLYWTGRARELTGQEDLATGAYRAAAAETSFYALEAGRRLGGQSLAYPRYSPLPTRPERNWQAVEAWYAGRSGSPAPPWKSHTAAGILARLGLRGDADAALNAFSATNASPDILLDLVREASEAGLARTATVLLQRLLGFYPTPYDDLPATLQGVLYPLPYPSLLAEQAESYDLDPLFLAALVRQESLWDPGAVSFAGALGLTQVMPATASDIARALGEEPFDPGSLFDPRRSLRFGAYYLASQLRAFLSPLAALAAYNGGYRNAIYWASLHDPEADPASFLENITFPETRRYVEFVMTGYARYSALARR